MMRRDVARVHSKGTVAECRQEFPLGSHFAVFVEDERGYRGAALLSELFSSDLDATADTTNAMEIAKYTETALLGSMNVRFAMKAFERAEAEVLPVLDSVSDRRVVGFLTEAYARRRYIQELDRATGNVLASS